MNELVEFLLARIAEDDAVARSAEPDWPGDNDLGVVEWEGGQTVRIAAGRVLAECDAKRRIVSGLTAVLAQARQDQQRQNAETTLRHLAAVYADHPDYRQEWTP